MSDNTPTLADYARRMRALVEEDVRIAADLRELAKEMRECGHRPVVIKALVKALVLAEEYDNPKPLEAMKERAQDVAMYGAALGIEIDGFGDRAPKRNGVNDSGLAPSSPTADAIESMSDEEFERTTAAARDFIKNGFAKVSLSAADPDDHSEDGLEHFDATPHDIDGVVLEPELEPTRAPSSTAAASIPDTSAAIPGGAESHPGTLSPDAVPPADASPSGQSGQALTPIPVRSHTIREPAPAPVEMPNIPDHLRRTRAEVAA